MKETAKYAVIFVSQLSRDTRGYTQMSEEMVTRVKQQPGFLGFDSVRGDDGVGITVSYWESLEAIDGWKTDVAHGRAQRLGREHWYENFALHVARIERSRSFP